MEELRFNDGEKEVAFAVSALPNPRSPELDKDLLIVMGRSLWSLQRIGYAPATLFASYLFEMLKQALEDGRLDSANEAAGLLEDVLPPPLLRALKEAPGDNFRENCRWVCEHYADQAFQMEPNMQHEKEGAAMSKTLQEVLNKIPADKIGKLCSKHKEEVLEHDLNEILDQINKDL